jgi:diguanylate cyclase (GGDEF)-like protein/PAS domain S-box-containing protein
VTEETTARRFLTRLRSLEAQLGMVLVLLVLLPASLVTWLAYDHTIEITRTDRIKTVGRVADARHEQLKMVLQRATDRAAGMLTDLRNQCGDLQRRPGCVRQGLESFIRSEGALGATIGTALGGDDTQGLTVGESAAAADRFPPFKVGQLARFTERGAGPRRSYFIVVDSPRDQLRLAVTYPVDVIQPVFASHPDLGNSGETFLADEQGFFITSARYPSTQGHSHPISATPMRRCLTPESAETLDLDYRDVPIIHGFRFIPEIGGGCIMAHVDQAEAFAPLDALKNKFLAAMLGLAVLAILAAMYLAQRLTRPLRDLTRVTGAIAAGNHALRAAPTGYSEVSELAAAFNVMTDKLVSTNTTLEQRVLERTQSLRDSEERWQFALEGAGDGVWDWNLENGEIIYSRRYQEMLGYTDGIAWNCLDDWKSHVNPEEMQTAMVSLEAYLDGKTPSYSAEYRMQCADGSWKWMLARGKVVNRAQDGRPLRLIGTHTDITERKEAEAALQASESRFRSIFENANTGIASTDGSGRVTSFNEAFRTMLGYDAEALGRMSFRDFTHPDDLELENEFFNEILAGQRHHYRITKRYIDSESSILWVDISVSVIRDAQGKVANFIGVIQNITESREAEEALRDGHETLRSILATTLDGYWRVDEQGRLLDANPAYCGQSGYTHDELLGMRISDLEAAETPTETAAHIRQLIEDGSVLFESRHRRKDGSIWYVEVSATFREIAGGHLFVFLRDITERKQAEETLRATTERLNEAERIAQLGAWELDHVTGKLDWSDEVFRIFEIDPLRFSHRYQAFLDTIHPDDRTMVNQAFTDSLETRAPYGITHRMLTSDGRIKWVHERCASEFDADGKPLRSRGMVQDITERKQIEDQVRHLAFYDSLTQLPNRRLLFDRLSQTMAVSKRSGCYGALMFLDLDNFKPLNDLHGHAIGDLLLIEAATRLKGCVREADTVARFGGDEFVVIISELNTDRAASIEEATVIAQKIRSALAAPYLLTANEMGESARSIEHQCAASIGVALFVGNEASQEDALKWADTAMYQAKQSGRNSIRLYAE